MHIKSKSAYPFKTWRSQNRLQDVPV